MTEYIEYKRVSTGRQGVSGLGLEAQQKTVRDFIKHKGGKLIAEFTEIESGGNNNRQELNKAIELAKDTGATLLIAKLDRLARNTVFILTLKESGVKFVACDMPEANHMTIGIMALMAEQERKFISERIKAALAAKKARGEVWNTGRVFTDEHRQKASEVVKENARRHKANIRASALIRALRPKGYTFRAIADELNNNGFKTVRGGVYYAGTVQKLWKRIKDAE